MERVAQEPEMWAAQEGDEDGSDLDEIIDQVTNEVFVDGAPEPPVVKKARLYSPSTTAKSPSLPMEGHSASPAPVSSSNKVFALATLPGLYAGQ